MALIVVAARVSAALVLPHPTTRPSPSSNGRQDPGDFVATGVTELDGTSTSATYGAPYNHPGTGQISRLPLQLGRGPRTRRHAVDFVLGPLAPVPTTPP